jgi:hypothetical protein
MVGAGELAVLELALICSRSIAASPTVEDPDAERRWHRRSVPHCRRQGVTEASVLEISTIFRDTSSKDPLRGLDCLEPCGLSVSRRPRSQNRDVRVPETRRIRNVPFEEPFPATRRHRGIRVVPGHPPTNRASLNGAAAGCSAMAEAYWRQSASGESVECAVRQKYELFEHVDSFQSHQIFRALDQPPFSARGPLGARASVYDTRWPSFRDSNGTPLRSDLWKKRSLSVTA